MKLGIIADIHSNAPALAAVLADLARHKVDLVVQLGDAFNGPIAPAEVMALLRARPMLHVKGNGERMVLAEDPAERSASATYARSVLSEADLAWVAAWPARHDQPEFTACHGSPRSDLEYLLEEVTSRGVFLRSGADIAARLEETVSPLVLCGHTHLPRVVRLLSGTLVVNPGSVGLPAYADVPPFPHRMETGSPHARYAVTEVIAGEWAVSLCAVAYDWEAAAKLAEARGFPDWVVPLRTGYVR
ncbi:MAG: metallophosphoesterase family protein [Opitutaceae bacterium]|nr:metallophosphoesterase family protein [Opitutaceae bacterium]